MTWMNQRLKQVKSDSIFKLILIYFLAYEKRILFITFFPVKFDEKGQSKEETSNQCKNCKYSGKHLMMHLSMSKRCKEKYDLEESKSKAGKI